MVDMNAVNAMKHRVFIAMPQGELARYTDYDLNLDRVVCPPQTLRQRGIGLYISNIQNGLARLFMKSDFEWFWLLNDDQIYPPDTLIRLLSHNKDVVVPVALEKFAPYYPLIYGNDQGNGHFDRMPLKPGEGHGLKPISACGGGGMLIHRRVFEKIEDPWWTQTMYREGGDLVYSSEDFDFCRRVNAAGFQIYADLDVCAMHITQFAISPVYDEARKEWATYLTRKDDHIVIPAAPPLHELAGAAR